MDTLITQSDLQEHVELGKRLTAISESQAKLRATPEYIALEKEASEAGAKRSAIEKRILEAAKKAEELGVPVKEEGKSKYPDLDPVTEPGAFRATARFGTSDTTSWKGVVAAIKAKNCVYTNGDGKLHPLNSVLSSIEAGQTETRTTSGVTVALKK